MHVPEDRAERQRFKATLRTRVEAHLRAENPAAPRALRRKAARIAVAQLIAELQAGPIVLDHADPTPQ